MTGTIVRVNEHCAALQQCTAVAPDLFQLVGDRAEATTERLSAEQLADAEDAADVCPMRAIEIV